MAYFTELGLSGKPEKKPDGNASQNNTQKPTTQPVTQPKKPGDKKKTAMLAGSLIATSLLGVFFLESGCSKSSNQAATIATPVQTAVSQPSLANLTPPTSTSLTNQMPAAKKKSRQRKLAASGYNNPTYGVSFRYPKLDSLKEGDKANLEWDGLGPVEMNFVQTGGTTVSAVELPRKLYAGTDFNSAFFNVSVNSKLTAEECAQFAFPEASETDPVVPSKTKVGATEFNVLEGFAGEDTRQADVKYYHVFENGSCYEFALGLETEVAAGDEDVTPAVKPVDHNEVFRKLNWILSTVKIQPVDLPGKDIPEVAADTPSVPVDATVSQAH